jgi:L-asparaginase/Glu-tRNA(Gln) amidotransferase subunit D
MVGSERFTWELVSVDKSERCRLSLTHTGGTITEYFTSATAALQRQSELESLLTGVPVSSRGEL